MLSHTSYDVVAVGPSLYIELSSFVKIRLESWLCPPLLKRGVRGDLVHGD